MCGCGGKVGCYAGGPCGVTMILFLKERHRSDALYACHAGHGFVMSGWWIWTTVVQSKVCVFCFVTAFLFGERGGRGQLLKTSKHCRPEGAIRADIWLEPDVWCGFLLLSLLWRPTSWDWYDSSIGVQAKLLRPLMWHLCAPLLCVSIVNHASLTAIVLLSIV